MRRSGASSPTPARSGSARAATRRLRRWRSSGSGGPRSPAGHYPGLAEPVPTIDFTGWLLFCREDLPAETAYALARATDETRPRVEAGEAIVRGPLTLPIDPSDSSARR